MFCLLQVSAPFQWAFCKVRKGPRVTGVCNVFRGVGNQRSYRTFLVQILGTECFIEMLPVAFCNTHCEAFAPQFEIFRKSLGCTCPAPVCVEPSHLGTLAELCLGPQRGQRPGAAVRTVLGRAAGMPRPMFWLLRRRGGKAWRNWGLQLPHGWFGQLASSNGALLRWRMGNLWLPGCLKGLTFLGACETVASGNQRLVGAEGDTVVWGLGWACINLRKR